MSSIHDIMKQKKESVMMYRLIACDLDETLLNDSKEICERNIQAIERARKEYGVRFVPATGRGYTCIDHVLKTLQSAGKQGEYIISNNGGVITENHDMQAITFHALAFEKAKELCAFGFQKDVCVQVFTATDVYAFHLNEDERHWLYSFKPDSIECRECNIDMLQGIPITKVLFQNRDVAYLQALAQEMPTTLKDGVSISFSSNRYMELNTAGVDKGSGLTELARHLQINLEDTIAIGDNFNDIGMLKVAGLSVAVANAHETIQSMCDYVTIADNNQGGVAEVIERYIFQEATK